MDTTHSYAMASLKDACHGKGTWDPSTQACKCSPESHRTGSACDKCVDGFSDDGAGNCVKFDPCGRQDACGCLPSNDPLVCVPRGTCSADAAAPGGYKCTCTKTNYAGAHCDTCAAGFSNLPLCTRECSQKCEHGTCDTTTGSCSCAGNWAGPSCSSCLPGFSGSDCEQQSSALKIVGGVAIAVLGLAAIAAIIWWFKFRRGASEDSTLSFDLGGVRSSPVPPCSSALNFSCNRAIASWRTRTPSPIATMRTT